MSEQIRDFTERFFKNIKCDLKWEGEVLVVENVPQNFQKFFGKNAPYRLNFISETDDADFITKGSYLLKAMNEFLTDKGQTALLKIDFDIDLERKIMNDFPLMNCEISKVSKSAVNEVFVRFTFLTTFQYLNEKEQVMSHIYVRNGKIVDLDVSKFKTTGGNKRDIKIERVEEEYALAKAHLKVVLESKMAEVGDSLNKVLDKEIERVKNHYKNQTSEAVAVIERLEERIAEAEKQRGQVGNMELEEIELKIRRLQDEVVSVKERTGFDKLKAEEEFFIQDEISKHGLNVNNKLLNTTLVYYPIYNINLFLKSNQAKRMVEMVYNPFDEKMSKVFCDSCNKEVNEFIVCSSGHLTCRDCGLKCECCEDVFCEKCSGKVCEECGKKICPKCALKCSVCNKIKCKTHLGKDPISQRIICKSCLKRCSSCGKLISPEYIRSDSNSGMDVCQKCMSKQVGKETLDEIFQRD